MTTWPEDWTERMAGVGCPMCANQGREDNGFGCRILQGVFADVFLQRAAGVAGYAIAIWRDGHAAEPTELDPAAAAGYWTDTLRAASAIADRFAPAKLNFLTLGNAVPHLHTHIVPRYLDDPAPGRPLPWDVIAAAEPMAEDEFTAQVADLRARLGAGPGGPGLSGP